MLTAVTSLMRCFIRVYLLTLPLAFIVTEYESGKNGYKFSSK
jgi:hypothetical protein